MATRSFTITGEKQHPNRQTFQQHDDAYVLEEVLQIERPSRDGNNTIGFELSDAHIAEMQFSDGTIWIADSSTINDVFPELDKQQRDGVHSGQIPISLRDNNADRSVADVVLRVIKLFRRKEGSDLLDKGIHHLAQNLENKQLEFSEADSSTLYNLQPNFTLHKGTISQSDKPYILFIHGTASSTNGSFGKLYGTPEWELLTKHYGDNILAFQHRTLTDDPFDNIEALIAQLPEKAALHLVTHSRGGLVGDLLSRFCAVDSAGDGFTKEELAYWQKKASHHGYAEKAKRIAELLAGKNIRVEKMVRVACPAAGTTLASKRLEYFFNVTLNLIGVVTGQNANPIYSAFKTLIGEIIKKKDDADALPGLAAQNPDGAFIKVLNHTRLERIIQTPLYVIAGNAKPDVSLKALMVIVTRLFFIGKNDMVVNTASMTNGAMRLENKTMWLFDEGGKVTHFNYFGNALTRKAMTAALLHTQSETSPEGFTTVRQKLTQGELRQAALGIEGGNLSLSEVSGKKPVCIIIPGIMGSNLSVNEQKVWLNYWSLITGGLQLLNYEDENNLHIKPTSLVASSYQALARYLQTDYDVVTHAFDWRLNMPDNAKLLAGYLKKLLDAGVTIKVIGHSMGGVLMRDLMVFENDTWDRLQKSTGFQLLFLGSPLGGSFRIPYVIMGEDAIIKTLSKVDISHSRKELAQLFCAYRGLLCLLPLSNTTGEDYADPATWELLRNKSGDSSWPIPDAASLLTFKRYRDDILSASHKISYNKAVYIAGRDKQTPYGFRVVNETIVDKKGKASQSEKIEYLMTAEGDQSVTWQSGIPIAMSDLQQVYFCNASHGSLANDQKLFAPIADILRSGKTNVLSKEKPSMRGDAIGPAIDPDTFDLSEDGIEKTLLSMGEMETLSEVPTARPLRVKVNHGDIMYATYPVLAGHFINDGLFSVERAIDWHLDGELNRRMQLGLYPGEIGTYDLLLSYGKQKNFKGALIVGLGLSGKLNSFQLGVSVEKGILKYLTVYNADKTRINFKTGVIGISAPAIGCGYGGLSIESSLRGILSGIQRANAATKLTYGEEALLVEEVEFIEIFNDRALDYMYNLSKLSDAHDSGLQFRMQEKRIGLLKGRRQRIPIDDTTDWWTRVTVDLSREKNAECQWVTRGLRFTMSTNTAREEKAEIHINLDMLSSILEEASKSNRWNEDLARTIYELLIPNQFKEFMNKQNNILWIVNKDTAGFPWELLKHAQPNAKPLSVSCGMMRQMATQDFRQVINQVASKTALVVGDPDLKGWQTQLSGALEEGKLVNVALQTNGFQTTALFNSGASEILVALFSAEYKILHLAGHGIFDEDPDKPSGMLIGKDAILTPGTLQQMSKVPELVFLNCCHLGNVDSVSEQLTQSRYKLAANLGTQLIDIGVKAVVVAGWAVDDATANIFAQTLYRQLFDGENFGNAVQKARNKAYELSRGNNNTWGAYQTYGDPFYLIDANAHVAYGSKQFNFVVESQVEMELYNLLSKQETGTYSSRQISEPLDAILKEAEADNLLSPRSVEIAAMLAANLGNYEQSINFYKRLLSNNKASFEIKSLEQYCNVRAKFAVEQFETKALKIKDTLKELDQLISDLGRLIQIAPNGERYSLLASTQKRKAKLMPKDQRQVLLAETVSSYKGALAFYEPGSQYYPMVNQYCLVAMQHHNDLAKWGDDNMPDKAIALQQLQDELKICELNAARMDSYWDMVAVPTIMLCMHMVDPRLHYSFDEIKTAFEKVWANAGTSGNVKAEIENLDFLLLMMGAASGGTAQAKTVVQTLKGLKKYADEIYAVKNTGKE